MAMAREQDDVRPQAQTPPGAEEDYEELLEDYSHFAPPAQGEIYEGRVLKVTDKEVIVDFGYKTEGLVPIEQFVLPDGRVTVQPGDVVDVMVDRGIEVDGYILLSHEKAVRVRAWENLEKAYRERLLVSALVLGRTKGGLTVDVGVKAFMPASQIDVRPVPNPESLIGQYVPVRILKLNRRRGNVVVSRKLAIEEEINARKAAILEALEEGAVVTGVVKSLTDYGAFIDLGGLDGLLHVSDMSYGRVNHPSELLNVGDEITVKVLKVDREKERVSLGLKQLLPDPWETAAERYPVGSRVVGRVMSITDYGAFVELEPGIEGLIHITEMTWSRRLKHPSKVVKVGDQVQAVVLSVQPAERRISLGIKQLEPDPWTTVEQRYSVGSIVEGRVRKLTDFGAFVEIEEGIDGLVHISDLSWSKRVKHPPKSSRKDRWCRPWCFTLTAPIAAFRSASSNCSPTPGRLSSVPIRWATSCADASPEPLLSASSWNWRKASKGCATTRKFRGPPSDPRASRRWRSARSTTSRLSGSAKLKSASA
jgi:small subunit ribosomal protein S1